jgi:hypothetical protein
MASSQLIIIAIAGNRPATSTTPDLVVTAELAWAQTSSGARETGAQLLPPSNVQADLRHKRAARAPGVG